MGGDPFVFGINYRMPSEAAFYLPESASNLQLCFSIIRPASISFGKTLKALEGRNADLS